MREMKDSGIPWVGQIPDDWIIKRGKFTLKLLSRPVLDTDEVITWAALKTTLLGFERIFCPHNAF